MTKTTAKVDFDEVNSRYKALCHKCYDLQFHEHDLRYTRVSEMTPAQRADHEADKASTKAAIKAIEAELVTLGKEWTAKHDAYMRGKWTEAHLYFPEDVRADVGI